MIEKIFSAERVAQMDYFMKEAPIVDWQWMFVIGIFFGASIAAKISGTYKARLSPICGASDLAVAFSNGQELRLLAAFLPCSAPPCRRLPVGTWPEWFSPTGGKRLYSPHLFFYRRSYYGPYSVQRRDEQ